MYYLLHIYSIYKYGRVVAKPGLSRSGLAPAPQVLPPLLLLLLLLLLIIMIVMFVILILIISILLMIKLAFMLRLYTIVHW